MLNLEHEAKSLISKEDFLKLKSTYQLNDAIIQRNIYLETRDEYYRNQGGALRIRSYNDTRFELTLKLKDGRSNAEYNFDLTKEEFDTIVQTNILPKIELPIEIKQPENQFTTVTKRYKLPYEAHIIEIDETLFEQTNDYEIEVEAESISTADAILSSFLKENKIEFCQSQPKIARYFVYNPQ